MRSMEGVATFVGIDAHASRCSVKALSENAVEVLAVDVPTARTDLREALEGLSHPVWAMLEASTMAPFVRECLGGVVDRVIVCETRENRWVAKSEDKSDPARRAGVGFWGLLRQGTVGVASRGQVSRGPLDAGRPLRESGCRRSAREASSVAAATAGPSHAGLHTPAHGPRVRPRGLPDLRRGHRRPVALP